MDSGSHNCFIDVEQHLSSILLLQVGVEHKLVQHVLSCHSRLSSQGLVRIGGGKDGQVRGYGSGVCIDRLGLGNGSTLNLSDVLLSLGLDDCNVSSDLLGSLLLCLSFSLLFSNLSINQRVFSDG